MIFNPSIWMTTLQLLVIKLGIDPNHFCGGTSHLTSEVLKRSGIKTTFCYGYAAWRVNDFDAQAVYVNYENDFINHIWLETEELVIDFNTFWLDSKFRELDKTTGRKTIINWKPDYIWMRKDELLSKDVLLNEMKVGAYYITFQKETKRYALVKKMLGDFHNRTEIAKQILNDLGIALQPKYESILDNPNVITSALDIYRMLGGTLIAETI